MKKFKLAVLAVVVAITSFAFTTTAPDTAKQTNLHWFNPAGTYVGQRSIADEELLCPGNSIECAKGYTSVSGNPAQPVGDVQYTAKKQSP
jgi:hypothetical protein